MIPENDKRVIAMRKMGYSDYQIEEMLEDDKAVDRGEVMPWDLSAEEHKKAMRNAILRRMSKVQMHAERSAFFPRSHSAVCTRHLLFTPRALPLLPHRMSQMRKHSAASSSSSAVQVV